MLMSFFSFSILSHQERLPLQHRSAAPSRNLLLGAKSANQRQLGAHCRRLSALRCHQYKPQRHLSAQKPNLAALLNLRRHPSALILLWSADRRPNLWILSLE